MSSSSGSDSDSSDSDCVLLYSTSGPDLRKEVCCYIPSQPFRRGEDIYLMSSSDLEMEAFAEDVLRSISLFTEPKDITFFWSKLSISSIGHEEDVIVTPCIPGEKVCIQCPKGVKDEMYHMYAAVLEEFKVKIPFTPFDMDVLKFVNMTPSQIQPNSWAFIRGFEILCKALELEPSVGVFFHFYGMKGVNKMLWVSISAHPGKKLFSHLCFEL